MADCFISYRRTPSAPVATTLQSMLESKHGLDVYVDTTRTDGTRVRFPERLMQAIEDAPVFVCLLGERDGEHTLESEWVLKEIQQAYDLGKFCIPVFQESYRPLADIPPAVDYLLGFDGVHILDQKNIMIDESVRKIAELIRPQRKKQLSPVAIGAAIIFTLAAVAGGVWFALSGPNPPVVTPTLSDVTPLYTPTDTPVAEPSPTASPTPTATPTSTATLSSTQVEQTIQAEMTGIYWDGIHTAEAAETATAEQNRQHEQGTAAALTLTATHLPPTPTIDSRATAEARVTQTQAAANTTATANAFSTATAYARQTQQAATKTQEWIDSWTPSPTITLTPSFTPTPDVAQIALTPQTSNADWSPIERDFDGVMMVLVPSGCFMMGSNSGDNNEQPAHRRCFAEPFWIDKFEVRQAQFAIFSGIQANPSAFTGINLPVESITWYEARDFCELRGGSLPSELEWEYAARGPNSLAYPWGNQFIADNVIYGNNSDSQTRFVSTRPNGVSWVGAFHMSGNVWEWTRTAYRNYPYSKTDGRDNTNSAAYRVVRGGSWNSSAAYVRAAYRSELSQNYFNRTVGFRCMRPVD